MHQLPSDDDSGLECSSDEDVFGMPAGGDAAVAAGIESGRDPAAPPSPRDDAPRVAVAASIESGRDPMATPSLGDASPGIAVASGIDSGSDDPMAMSVGAGMQSGDDGMLTPIVHGITQLDDADDTHLSIRTSKVTPSPVTCSSGAWAIWADALR